MANSLKVDAHQHFWIFDPVRDSWIDDDMAVIRKHFMPGDLETVLKDNGIEKCIAVQADQSLQQNDFLLDFARKHDFIAGVVGWVDLQSDAIEEQLQQYATEKKMKGFRHVLQGEPNRALMLERSFTNGIGKLAKYGYAYDVLIFTDQIKYAAELAAVFPDQPFVLDHIAKPKIKTGEIDQWAKDVKYLASFENMHCKVSGMVTEADWQGWKYDDFVPYLDVAFEAFGVQRLMYGSDWPVCNVAGGYQKAKSILDQYTAKLSETEQALFWGENAARFYNL